MSDTAGERSDRAADQDRLATLERRAAATAERVARLRAMTTALSTARTVSEIAALLATEGRAAVGAAGAVVAVSTGGAGAAEIVAGAGALTALRAWPADERSLPAPLAAAIAEAVRTGQATLHPAATGELAVAIPLRAGDAALGVLGVIVASATALATEDEQVLLTLAEQCAQALERARLQATAHAAQARATFLIEASARLAASLDYETTLQQVARLAVSSLADWCTIDLADETGELRRLAVVHADPAKERLVRRLMASPPRPPAAHPILEVMRTGRALLSSDRVEETLMAATRDDLDLALARSLGGVAVMIVPLRLHDRLLGAISLVASVAGRRYGPDDLALAQALADRAAVAIENAHLFRAARQAEAHSQQQAARMTALAVAAGAFSEAQLDVDHSLATISRQVAELLDGMCVIRLVSDDGQWLEPVSIYHRDPAVLEAGRATFLRQRVDEGWQGRVVRTGATALLAAPSLDELRAVMKPEHWPFYERFGVFSFLVVLLRARGRVLGTLTVGRDQRQPAFTPEDRLFVEDLADRAALAVDNARLYAAEQAAVRRRDAFLSIAAHELKTPVTGLKGYAQLMLRNQARGQLDEGRLTRSLQAIDQMADRLATLTSDLLDIAHVRTGRLSLRLAPTSVAELIEAVVERYGEGLGQQHHLALARPLAEGVAQVDPDRLEQVVINVLDNAVKYSPGGGPIALSLDERDEGLLLSVRDQGIGLPPDAVETIFQPFGRAPNAAQRHLPGMGLGLAICRSIVDRHGGRIWAESAGDGQGATFRVWLPLAESAAAAGDDA